MIDVTEYAGLTEIIELTEYLKYSEYIDMIGIRDNIDATEITNSRKLENWPLSRVRAIPHYPLAPEAGEPATRQLRQAWSGKNQLTAAVTSARMQA